MEQHAPVLPPAGYAARSSGCRGCRVPGNGDARHGTGVEGDPVRQRGDTPASSSCVGRCGMEGLGTRSWWTRGRRPLLLCHCTLAMEVHMRLPRTEGSRKAAVSRSFGSMPVADLLTPPGMTMLLFVHVSVHAPSTCCTRPAAHIRGQAGHGGTRQRRPSYPRPGRNTGLFSPHREQIISKL